jgi:hypothetical protein
MALGAYVYNTVTQAWESLLSLPNKPAFHATQIDGSVTFPAGNIVFNTTKSNVGNVYNTSNGRFTAPVAGHYHLSVHFFKYTSYINSSNTYWGFTVNGAARLTINHGAQSYDGGQTLAATIYLNAGDYVNVTSDQSIQTWGDRFCHFSGYLV